MELYLPESIWHIDILVDYVAMASEDMPTWFNVYDPLVDPLVLAGSCLSGLMTFLVLLTFAIYNQEQRTFRHALVFNLTGKSIHILSLSVPTFPEP